MALRQAMLGLRSALRPAAPQLLANLPRAICTSGTVFRSAEAAASEGGGAPAKQGWGQTRIYDILKSKADNDGAWLWCSQDDYVIDAVRKMTKGNVGSLLVFDPSKLKIETDASKKLKSASSEAVVGLVTERDYLTKVVVVGKSSSDIAVADIMTPQQKLKTVTPNDNVLEVMMLMIDNNFRHVPVVDEGNYLGMISIRDVVSTMVSEHREEVDRLHEYIQGSY